MKNTPNRTILVGLLLSAVVAQGAVTVELNFDNLSTGNIDGQDGWRVTDQPNRSATVVSGGLSYSSGTVNRNGGSQALQLVLEDTGLGSDPATDFVGRNITPVGAAGETVYFSFLMQLNDGRNSYQFVNFGLSGADTSADIGTDLSDDWSRISSAAAVVRGDDQFRLWDSSGGATGTNTLNEWTFGNETNGGSFLLIGRLTFNGSGDETLDFTINPNSTVEGDATWKTVSADTGVESLSYFGVYANVGDNQTMIIDDILIGTDYSSVVPEPSTYALFMGLAGLGFLLLRRRKQ
jgi:hypothetical protein